MKQNSLSPSKEAVQQTPLDFAAEFPILNQITFMNHAAVAPLTLRAGRALRNYADEATEMGGAVWNRWASRFKHIRKNAAALLGAEPDEIAFTHNTTHGLLCLANSLPWAAGDNIIGAEHEFPANIHPWRNLAERGVALRLVPESPDRRFNIDDFAARIDQRTRMISVSLVQYSTGFRMPVEQLAQLCRERGIWFCIDGIQAVGAMPVNVREIGCDFLSADSHKWMLGPEGAGLLYVRKELLELMNDSMTGWLGRVRPWDYDDTGQPNVRGAARFEEGTHNMAGVLAMGESLGLLTEVGAQQIWRNIEALADQLEEGLRRLGCNVISPRGTGERSGIVAFEWPGKDPVDIVKRLEAEKIYVAARRGWIRVSPHFYNRPEQIEHFLTSLAKIGG